MDSLERLIKRNREWAAGITSADPDFFGKLSAQQAPEYLWIGCSDSRVPATQIVDVAPGEIFVHRNVGNLVIHSDLNCLSTIQFAVDVLKVRHIIVCGHYGCGAVTAAYRGERHGLVDNWLRHIQDIVIAHRERLASVPDEESRLRLLAEVNVITQVVNVVQTTVLQDAWSRRGDLEVHGWIYGLKDGHLTDLDMSMDRDSDVTAVLEAALAKRRAV